LPKSISRNGVFPFDKWPYFANKTEGPECSFVISDSAYRAARSVFMELCCVYLARKMSFAEIGRKLGGVSVAALTQNRKRLSSRMEDDPGLRHRFQKLTQM